MSAELSSHSAEPVSLLITSGAPAAPACRERSGVTLKSTANLSTGGTAVDITDLFELPVSS